MKLFDNILNAMGQTYSLVGVDPQKVLLEFDTIDECTTGGSATVTKYPTEKGTYVTDYKYKNPDTVRMVGIISSGGMTGYTSILSRLGTWDRQTAIEMIREKLKDLTRDMTLLNIQTRNAGRRDNMTMTAYEINETYDNFGSMEVTMQFQEVRRFNSDMRKPANPSDSPTQDNGITMTQAIGAGVAIMAIGGTLMKNGISTLL